MKDFIISIFSPLLQLNIVISTIGGFILGGMIGGFGGMFGGSSFNTTTAFVGAILAFCNAAIVSGAGLALDRIRELLEEQTYRLQEQDRRERSQASVKAESPSPYSTVKPTSSQH